MKFAEVLRTHHIKRCYECKLKRAKKRQNNKFHMVRHVRGCDCFLICEIKNELENTYFKTNKIKAFIYFLPTWAF